MWPAGRRRCLSRKMSLIMCELSQGVLTYRLLTCCGGWALFLTRWESVCFKHTKREGLNLTLREVSLCNCPFSRDKVLMWLSWGHLPGTVCASALALPNNWWGIPVIYLLVVCFHLTAKPPKVLSCPRIILLCVHQPSFYKITGPKSQKLTV